MNEKDQIAACRRQDARAQRWVYERYAPVMMGLCRRYLRTQEEAEDVLVEGFYKVFSKIESYGGEGSFEGWIRRIMINEALMHLRKNDILRFAEEVTPQLDLQEEPSIEDELAANEILELLGQLPPGYRAVFNLYVIEGYKHREIAESLGISINTSKSQLILAKQKMEGLLRQRLGVTMVRRASSETQE